MRVTYSRHCLWPGISLTLLCFFSSYVFPAAPIVSPTFASRIFNPGPQIASGHDSWSLFNNPAGLAFSKGAELRAGYAYAWSNPSNFQQAEAASALRLFPGFDLGLGFQFEIPSELENDKGFFNAQLGLAYCLKNMISFGLWGLAQKRYSQADVDPFLLGLGIQYAPIQWFALGGTMKQVYGDWSAPFAFYAGISAKPAWDPLELFIETRFWPKDSAWSDGYDIKPITGFSLDLNGFIVYFNTVIQPNPLFMLGVDIDWDHFGFGVIGGNAYAGGRLKLSSEERSKEGL